MNLDRATELAMGVHGDRAAARLYADIEFELAMGEPTNEQEIEGDQALKMLEHRFPDIHGKSTQLVEDGQHIPRLSAKANREADRAFGDERHRKRQPQPERQGPRKTTTPHPHRGRAGARASRPSHKTSRLTRSQGRQRAPRLVRESLHTAAAAAAPQPLRSFGAFAWNLTLSGIGMAVVYLILRKPQIVEQGIVSGFHAFDEFVSPRYDVFPPAKPVKAKPTLPPASLGNPVVPLPPGVPVGATTA